MRDVRHRSCLSALMLSMIIAATLVAGAVERGWAIEPLVDSIVIKTVWVRVPDVRYGKLNVAFPVPVQYR